MPLGGPGIPRPSIQGERNTQAALTWVQVRSMRSEYTTGDTTYRKLASKHNISATMVALIIRNQRWTDPAYTPRLNPTGPR